MERRRRIGWVTVAVLAVVVSVLFVTLASPLWVWFAYESETIVLEENPVTIRDRNGDEILLFENRMFLRHGRKKRIDWGPGDRYRLEESVCFPCSRGDHGNHFPSSTLLEQPRSLQGAMVGPAGAIVHRCECTSCED